MRDFKRLQQDPPAGISGAPHDNNIMLWNAVIFGWVSAMDAEFPSASTSLLPSPSPAPAPRCSRVSVSPDLGGPEVFSCFFLFFCCSGCGANEELFSV